MSAMLILPPNSDGTPEKELSEIRGPLRGIITLEQQIDENMGARLAEWTRGSKPASQNAPGSTNATEQGKTSQAEMGLKEATQGQADDPKRKQVELLIENAVKEGMDKAEFLSYLDSISWRVNGQIAEQYLDKLTKPVHWKAIMQAFSKFIDQKNA
jgi:hypothetical protein